MNTQYAFLKKANLPDRERLQKVIDDLGYDLQLSPELNIIEDEGFSPCTLNGHDNIGFEICYEDEMDDFDEVPEIVGENDCVISMTWGGNFGDMACVAIVSLALMKAFGATTSYECDEIDTEEGLLLVIKEGLQGFEKQLKAQDA